MLKATLSMFSKLYPLRFELLVVFCFAVIVGGAVLWLHVAGQKPAPEEHFVMIESGVPHWYVLSGTSLSRVSALARDTDTRFSLASRADGVSIFAQISGTSSPPELFAVPADPSKKPVDLGKGFAAAFAPKLGVVVAVTPSGVMRINPGNAGHDTLISRPGLSEGTSAISPDARMAVLANSVTGSLDAFSLDDNASATSYVGSIRLTPDAIAFVTPTEFVAHSAAGYELYTIEKGAITKMATLALP